MKKHFSELSSVLSNFESVTILNAPYSFQNVGDLAILRGTFKILSENSIHINYVASLHSFNERYFKKRTTKGAILFAGGGWLNDQYPKMTEFANRILTSHKETEIIFLPFSCSGLSQERLVRFIALCEEHRNVSLFARDSTSYSALMSLLQAYGEKVNTKVYLAPDLAQFSEIEKKNSDSDNKKDFRKLLSIVARTDSESIFTLEKIPNESQDWYSSINRLSRLFAITFYMVPWISKASYMFLTKIQIAIGSLGILNARFIITDRLHVAILGTMAGSQVVVLKNSDCKALNYFSTWPVEGGNLQTAETFDEAISWVRKEKG
jgi:pyruvyl transferase EpsO